MEKQKHEFCNTIKQLKDSINSRLAPIVETVNSLASCSASRNSNHGRVDYSRSNNINNTNRSQNNNRNNFNSTNNNKPYNFINACLHCAKPNHKYFECNSATETDKLNIRNLLKERKYDFGALKEKAAKLAQQKKEKFNLAPLNSESPNQQ